MEFRPPSRSRRRKGPPTFGRPASVVGPQRPPGHCSPAPRTRLHAAARRYQRGQVVHGPSLTGYCLTPTAELEKTERDPISTSGPSISVCHQRRPFLRKIHPFLPHSPPPNLGPFSRERNERKGPPNFWHQGSV